MTNKQKLEQLGITDYSQIEAYAYNEKCSYCKDFIALDDYGDDWGCGGTSCKPAIEKWLDDEFYEG